MISQLFFLSVLVIAGTTQQSSLRSLDICEWRFNYRTSTYDNTCDTETTPGAEYEPPKFPTTNIPKNTNQPKAKRKKTEPADKTVDANFILINKGIDYKQKDDVKNTIQEVKIPVNCVLLVAQNNQCYGWQNGPQGRYVRRPVIRPQIRPLPVITLLPPPPPPPKMMPEYLPSENGPTGADLDEPADNPISFLKMFLRQMAPYRRRGQRNSKKTSLSN